MMWRTLGFSGDLPATYLFLAYLRTINTASEPQICREDNFQGNNYEGCDEGTDT